MRPVCSGIISNVFSQLSTRVRHMNIWDGLAELKSAVGWGVGGEGRLT